MQTSPTSFQHMQAYRPLLCITLETEPLVLASLTFDRGQIVVRLCQHWIYRFYANSFWSPGRQAILSNHMSAGEFTYQGHGALEFNYEGWDIPDIPWNNRWSNWSLREETDKILKRYKYAVDLYTRVKIYTWFGITWLPFLICNVFLQSTTLRKMLKLYF